MNGSADCDQCSPMATDEEPPGPLDLSSSILSTDLTYCGESVSVDTLRLGCGFRPGFGAIADGGCDHVGRRCRAALRRICVPQRLRCRCAVGRAGRSGSRRTSDSLAFLAANDQCAHARVSSPAFSGRGQSRVERLAVADRGIAFARSRSSKRCCGCRDEEREALVQGGTMLPVGISPYYMSLLDADDPLQPLRRTVVPTLNEFVRTEGEADDPLGEDSHSPVPGLVHRYPDRVLLLPLDFCSTYCRYCTRSRVVGHGELMPQESRLMAAFDYLRRTPQIRDVLISGGDALALGEDRLEWILRNLRAIPEHRVHPHRHQDAGRVAAADHARAVPHAAALSSDLDERALHPPGRVHARSGPGLCPAGRRRHSARLADGAAQGRQRRRRDDAAADAQAAADAGAAVLFVPVRSDQRLVALPHAVAKGLEIIEGLRGHTTGYAVPTYVIDAPGGGGKIPLQPDSVIGRDGDWLLLRNYEGREYRYHDPV